MVTVVPRSLLRRLSTALVMALLCAQWATAAYLCPQGNAAALPAAAEAAAMPDCAGMPATAMDPEQPQLCKAHCEKGTQSVNATPSPEPTPTFSVWAVLDWRAATTLPGSAGATAAVADASAQPPPGAPPIYIALRVLRQ